jgi:hypothetical protein
MNKIFVGLAVALFTLLDINYTKAQNLSAPDLSKELGQLATILMDTAAAVTISKRILIIKSPRMRLPLAALIKTGRYIRSRCLKMTEQR